jgi:hydrogenase nickel incorporation protein HypB
MCATCGCGQDAAVRVRSAAELATDPEPGHRHEHGPEHGHGHGHAVDRTHELELAVLGKNDAVAAANRAHLAAHRIAALNLMSSPGSGKTTLLVRTLTDLGARWPVGVIEGDQETALDARRIQATGAPVVQVNTGSGCHLDAEMTRRALERLAPADGSLVFVENVGNLVCPAMFDLGEVAKVVIISVTEGPDKPLKYPLMFAGADLVLINKSDLLPYVDFDVDTCVSHLRQVNPGAETIVVSATAPAGPTAWYDWLECHFG